METTQPKGWNKLWMLFLAAFAVAFAILLHQWGNVSYAEQASFFLSQIAFVLIPGMAVTLLAGPPEDRACFAILSYLAGIGVTVGCYFLFYALKLQDHLWICMTVVAALSVFGIYKKRRTLQKIRMDHRSAWALSALLAGALLLVLFHAGSLYNTPDVTGASAYLYQDLVWNTGNVTAAANGLPVMDIHVDGFSFGYHFFANAYLAVFRDLLGFSSYLLFFRMLAVVQAVVYAGSLYLLFTLLFQNKWAAAGAAAVAVFAGNTVLQHMLWYAYATPLGMGFAVAAAYCFLRYAKRMETAKVADSDFLLFLLFLALTAGTKAPFAGGLLAGAGVVILAALFRRKNVRNLLAAGVLTLVVFGGVYLGLVYGAQGFNGMQIAFGASMWMEEPAYYTAALAALGGTLPLPAIKLLTYPVYMALNYPEVVAAVLLLLVSLVRRGRQNAAWKLFLLSAVVAGFAATTVTYQPGLSNQFFMDGILPLCVFALLFTAGEFLSTAKRAGKIAVCCIVAFALAFSVMGTANALRTSAGWIGARTGGDAAAPPYDSISPGEYEAMLWLRENTPKDAVFASDRQSFTEVQDLFNARYYYYTAFSERQCYLEGYNYVNTREEGFAELIDERLAVLRDVYANDAAAIGRLLQDGVSYLTASRLVHPDFTLDAAYGTPVFENDAITVYRLHEP